MQKEQRYVGGPGQDIEVLAFRGGAFDTAVYLGTAQAWLLLERPAPALVTGISAGAISAAAFAEILQAGSHAGVSTAHEIRRHQAHRLREIMLVYADAPRELLRAWMPDTSEISAQSPLQPMKLPFQFEDERTARDWAARSKFGLIRLFNDIFDVDLRASAITALVRCALEFNELGDKQGLSWAIALARTAFATWRVAVRRAAAISYLLLTAASAVVFARRQSRGHGTRTLLSTGWKAVREGWRAGTRVVALVGYLAVLIGLPAWTAFAAWRLCANQLWIWELAGVVTAWIVLLASISVLYVNRRWLIDRILRRYDLSRELGNSYDLEQLLL